LNKHPSIAYNTNKCSYRGDTMSKLDANGRWESNRIILPEHREALIERKQPKPVLRQPPNNEELQLIKDYILLPMLLTFTTNGRVKAEKIEHMMQELFLLATDALTNLITSDLTHVRKSLRAANIKVWEDEQIDGTMWYRYLCRGYEDRFALTRDLVRAEMSVRLGKYFSEVFRKND